MISRRHFLGTSSAAAAGATLSPTTELLAEDSPQQAIPASIARLSSWADRATPITTAERAGRVEKAKRLMREQGLSALALTGGTSMVYFTGILGSPCSPVTGGYVGESGFGLAGFVGPAGEIYGHAVGPQNAFQICIV